MHLSRRSKVPFNLGHLQLLAAPLPPASSNVFTSDLLFLKLQKHPKSPNSFKSPKRNCKNRYTRASPPLSTSLPHNPRCVGRLALSHCS